MFHYSVFEVGYVNEALLLLLCLLISINIYMFHLVHRRPKQSPYTRLGHTERAIQSSIIELKTNYIYYTGGKPIYSSINDLNLRTGRFVNIYLDVSSSYFQAQIEYNVYANIPGVTFSTFSIKCVVAHVRWHHSSNFLSAICAIITSTDLINSFRIFCKHKIS